MSELKTRIESFFADLDQDHLGLIDGFYDPKIHFQDPLVDIHGREEMTKYYANLYRHVSSIQFEFSHILVEEQRAAAAWMMTLQAQLNKGRPIVVQGISHIHFGGAEGKAVYHRDYFDMGEFVYESIPVLSSLIRLVKKRLTALH